jgi:hypothetical protein
MGRSTAIPPCSESATPHSAARSRSAARTRSITPEVSETARRRSRSSCVDRSAHRILIPTMGSWDSAISRLDVAMQATRDWTSARISGSRAGVASP